MVFHAGSYVDMNGTPCSSGYDLDQNIEKHFALDIKGLTLLD